VDSPPPTSHGVALPLAVTCSDQSGLFAIDLTITAWRREPVSGDAPSLTLTIGAGTLHDADKGSFPLDGMELSMRVTGGRLEPLAVLDPGALTEFQQDGLLDAIATYLNGVSPAGGGLGDPP
jgi:hypothetical protein